MSYLITKDDGNKYLIHYGIQGQRWGIRNFQYEDGTLTPEGIKRYRKNKDKIDKAIVKKAMALNRSSERKYITNNVDEKYDINKYNSDVKSGKLIKGSFKEMESHKKALSTEKYKSDVEDSKKLDYLLNNPDSKEYQEFKNRFSVIRSSLKKRKWISFGIGAALGPLPTIIGMSVSNKKFDKEFSSILSNVKIKDLDKLDKN